MTIYLLAILIGVLAGLRAMTPPAAVSWAVALGWLDVGGTWLAFLASRWTTWILTGLALVELVGDQLPTTPSRTVPIQFGTRIVAGAFCGAALTGPDLAVAGALLGAVGAVIGTLGGRGFRARLAGSFGSDPPAAFIEDAIAIGGALLIVLTLR